MLWPRSVPRHFCHGARAVGPDSGSKIRKMPFSGFLVDTPARNAHPQPFKLSGTYSCSQKSAQKWWFLAQNQSKTPQKRMPQRHQLTKLSFLTLLPPFSQKWASFDRFWPENQSKTVIFWHFRVSTVRIGTWGPCSRVVPQRCVLARSARNAHPGPFEMVRFARK